MGANPLPRYSVEEYLKLDREAEHKSEFHDGEIFPIVDVTPAHAEIQISCGAAIRSRLPKSCRVMGPVRIRVSPTKFVYPDLAIVCGKPQLTDEQQDTLTNPKVVVEVLSPSTADYDRGGKFDLYRRLPSFEEYLIVFQDMARVEVMRKVSAGRWTMDDITDPDAIVPLSSIGVEFPLAELFDGILSPE